MRIELGRTYKLVKVQVRKYPADQRRLREAYSDELVKTGFFKVCPQASWPAAPHLVPKDSKSKYRKSIYLCPVGVATKAEQWPKPIIEAKLIDFIGSKHFACPAFCSSYWQCPIEPESYEACSIIAPQGTFISIRVLHGL